jgi:hypothetical protein
MLSSIITWAFFTPCQALPIEHLLKRASVAQRHCFISCVLNVWLVTNWLTLKGDNLAPFRPMYVCTWLSCTMDASSTMLRQSGDHRMGVLSSVATNTGCLASTQQYQYTNRPWYNYLRSVIIKAHCMLWVHATLFWISSSSLTDYNVCIRILIFIYGYV